MGPKLTLPQRESEICHRLREVRLGLKLGQPDFANELSIPRGRLAAYEYLRAPVRFALGYNLCERFGLSLKWLALGAGRMWQFTPVSKDVLLGIQAKELFSAAYDKHLNELVTRRLDEVEKYRPAGAVVIDNRRLGATPAQSHFENVHDFTATAAAQMPNQKRLDFAHKLNDLVFAYFPWDSESKPRVDSLGKAVTVQGVRADVPNWKELVADVKRLTKEQGAKAALAAELKTSRQNVNKWLSGGGAPSADLTLKLLRWVRKKQSK